jgi:CRISPR-associated protein Cas6
VGRCGTGRPSRPAQHSGSPRLDGATMTTDYPQMVDVRFTLSGRAGDGAPLAIPVDHGYALYGAIARVLPWVHGSRSVGIHPVLGQLAGGRRLYVTPRSVLALRVPAHLVPKVLLLAGQALDVDGCRLQVGVPMVYALRPAPRLRSRLVTIKGMLTPEAFLDAARAQLAALGIQGQPVLVPRRTDRPLEPDGRGGRDPWVRRTLRVRDRTVVGYALDVVDLAPDDAIRLQAIGLGGRRRFGCGIFLPLRQQPA